MTGTPSSSTGAQFGTNGNGFTLVNQSTIQGSGLIGSNAGALYENLSFANSGTVNANQNAATLEIGGDGSSTANSGILEATNGGILQISPANPTVNNSGGSLTANGAGSTVNVNAIIEGGTINTLSGGTVQTLTAATLDGTTQGPITISDGSTYTAGAGLTSVSGTLNLGTTTGGTLALSGQLRLVGNTTITGPGVVVMTGNPSGPTGAQIGTNGNGFTLTNQSTIQGSGLIGSNVGALYENLSLNNIGTINADTSGATLEIGGNGGSITNSGIFEATNGGILKLDPAAAIVNSGANITANGAGSTVNITDTIVGGTLNTLNGGVMQTVGSATLDASSDGAITLSNGSTYTAGSGTVTSVTGTLNLGTTMAATLDLGGQLRLTGNTTFSGPGVVLMTGDPSGPTGAQIGTNGNGFTLTNLTTIQGSGLIGSNLGALYENLSLNNSGTIDSNISGGTLQIGGNGGTITNGGVFEATNGGTLDLTPAAPIDNSNGSITAAGSGSAVNVTATIEGGTLNTLNGGVMQTVGSATLDASSHGAILLSDGSTYVSGPGALTSITGALNLGTSTGSNLALGGQLRLIGDTTFSGPGTVSMTGNPTAMGGSTGAQIGTNGNGFTLTNLSTIQGSGLIGSNVGALYENLNLANSGTVDATHGPNS